MYCACKCACKCVRACVRTSTVACRLAAYSRSVARLPLHTARRCIRSLRLARSQWSARCMLHDGVHDRRTHAASSCSTRFLSASAWGRAATVKNVLKRSSTCASTQSTNGLPPASAADSEQSARGSHSGCRSGPASRSFAKFPPRNFRHGWGPVSSAGLSQSHEAHCRSGTALRVHGQCVRVGLARSVPHWHLGLLNELRGLLDRLACATVCVACEPTQM